MICRLLSCIRSCDAVIPMRTWMRGLNTSNRNSQRVNLQSFRSAFNILCEDQFQSVLLQNRYQEPVWSISICKRKYSSRKLNSENEDLGRIIRSSKFLEFHDRITSQDGDSTLNLSEWEKLEDEIVTELPSIAPGLDYSIMKTLKNKPNASASFMRYIKSKRQPNLPVLTEFFTNCAEKYEDFVLDEFEQLMKNFDLDKIYMKKNRIVQGIAKTKEWRKCIDLLDFSFTSNEHRLPNVAILACTEVLKQSLTNRDYDSFFQVWNKLSAITIMNDMENVCNMFFKTWREGLIPFDLFIELLKLSELPLQEYQSRDVQTFLYREWKGRVNAKFSKIGKKSMRCSNCNGKIPEHEPINASVFQKMGKEIIHKMLIGSNIFKKTNPQELENFCSFMSNQKHPFDYIIDGLNIIHKAHGGDEALLHTLARLSVEGKRVLVITKGRLRSEAKFRKFATMFSLDSKSFDDCYLLLAAFLSGPQCYVVTNDDYRDHIAVVDPSLKRYFLKWRDQNRIFHTSNQLYYPPMYKWTAHETETGWHIPCRKSLNVDTSAASRSAYTLTDFRTRTFLCVQTSNYTPSSDLNQFRQSKNSYESTKLDDEVSK